MSLAEKIRRGFALVLFSALASRLLSLGADIALMRLLEVQAHGLLAFGLLVVNSCGLLRSLGLGEALVFSRQADQKSCDTGFWLSLGLGGLLSAGLWLAAPQIALLAADGDGEALTQVVRVLGLLVFVQALAAVPGALLERDLAFDRRLLVDVLPALVYALLAPGLALAGWGVWSMVWGRLAAGLVGGLVALWLSPWRPGRNFSLERARHLLGYGRYVAGAGLVSFLVVNIDDALVARLAGIEELGLYARAYLLANLPATALTHLAGRVAFPAYARLGGEQAARLYLQILGGVALLALPLSLGLVLLARPLTGALFGPRWVAMVPLLQWLGAYGLLRALLANTGPLFNALGAPQAILRTNLLQLGVLVVALGPLVHGWGAEGACAGVLLGTLLSAPVALRHVRRVANTGLRAQAAVLAPLVLPGGALALAAWGGRELAAARGDWAALGAGALAALLAYGLVIWGWRRPLLAQALALVRGGSHA